MTDAQEHNDLADQHGVDQHDDDQHDEVRSVLDAIEADLDVADETLARMA